MPQNDPAGEATRPPSPASPAPKQADKPSDKALHAEVEDKGWPGPKPDRRSNQHK